MDVFVASVVLTAGAPVLAVVALGNRLFLGPGILYSQARGGYRGDTFEVLKFRSMLHEQGTDGVTLTIEERSHPWGEMLRKTSLDEIPGLLNVLSGEMCLVGPRPLVARYLDRYDEQQAQRHRLPPGLTGLAQTSGRNLLTWEEKFELDNAYIDRVSVGTDLTILATTAWQMLTPWRNRGTDHATEFRGSIHRHIDQRVDNNNASERNRTLVRS